MLHKVGVPREVVVFAVFKDEDALVRQQLLFKDEVGNLGQFLQGIGRVGKDQVVLLLARLDEAEHIATDGNDIGFWLLAISC